jgi:hypothetical protein
MLRIILLVSSLLCSISVIAAPAKLCPTDTLSLSGSSSDSLGKEFNLFEERYHTVQIRVTNLKDATFSMYLIFADKQDATYALLTYRPQFGTALRCVEKFECKKNPFGIPCPQY